ATSFSRSCTIFCPADVCLNQSGSWETEILGVFIRVFSFLLFLKSKRLVAQPVHWCAPLRGRGHSVRQQSRRFARLKPPCLASCCPRHRAPLRHWRHSSAIPGFRRAAIARRATFAPTPHMARPLTETLDQIPPS